ncbi:RAI1 like protein [Cooperia oncophora]
MWPHSQCAAFVHNNVKRFNNSLAASYPVKTCQGNQSLKGQPNVNEPVTCREEFAMVVKSTLAATVGRPIRLVYSGEVDAINKDGDPIELKTQRHALEGTFWKQKSMKWWLQSFLIGIRDIVVGYRDDDGIVTKLRELLEEDGEACLVRYEQNRDEITIHSTPLPDIDFFTYAFRVHFNLE